MFHTDASALELLSPPATKAKIVGSETAVRENALHEIEIRFGPFKTIWHARIHGVDPPFRFVDTMERGPFAEWTHEHIFWPIDANTTELIDRIHCLPKPLIFSSAWDLFGSIPIGALLTFRHRVTAKALKKFAPPSVPPSTRKL